MKKAKLIDLLKSFRNNEIKDLSVFINQISYEESFVLKLFSYLYKQYPLFLDKNIEKEKVYKKLFPTKKYDENKLSKIMSELSKTIEDYIIVTHSRSNDLYNKVQLLTYYNERLLEKLYQQTEKEIIKLQTKMPISAQNEMLSYQFEFIRLLNRIKKDIRKPDFQILYDNINIFFETQKLRWQNINYTSMLPELKTTIITDNSVNMYYRLQKKISNLFVNNDDAYLEQIIDFLTENTLNFEKIEKDEIYLLLTAYTLDKGNNGNVIYHKYLFDIYNLMDKQGVFLNIYNNIDLASYKNYITLALKFNEIDAAEVFLEKYKYNLVKEIKEELYNFNKALILFEKKEYNTVLDLLLFCNFTDVFYKLNQRRLLVKTYFELSRFDESYFNLLFDYIAAFKKFLLTIKTIPQNYIILNKNFIKYTEILLSKEKFNNEEVKLYTDKLSKVDQISERNWLNEKIANNKVI